MTIKVESFREAEAIGNLIAKVSELEEENAKLKSAVAWQKETIAARDATIGRLKAVLIPFSEAADIADRLVPGGTPDTASYYVCVGDLREARAALEPNLTKD